MVRRNKIKNTTKIKRFKKSKVNKINQREFLKLIETNKREKLRQKQIKESGKEEIKYYEFEITSTSHYDSSGEVKVTYKDKKGKEKTFMSNYKSSFSYETNGSFQNMPKPKTLMKMAKNSLIKAFNSGRKGGYLKNSAFNELVDGNIAGLKVEKTEISYEKWLKLDNVMNADLEIDNNGFTWKGSN